MTDPRLERMLDELAIRSLTASYTDALNRGDVDAIGRVYDDDAVFAMMERPIVTGRDAILDVLRHTLSRYQLVMQLLHSGVVQVDGDVARARWQITEFQILVDGGRRFIAGRYEDEYARRARGWQFTRRTFTARYLGAPDLSSEARPDLPARFDLWPAGLDDHPQEP